MDLPINLVYVYLVDLDVPWIIIRSLTLSDVSVFGSTICTCVATDLLNVDSELAQRTGHQYLNGRSASR